MTPYNAEHLYKEKDKEGKKEKKSKEKKRRKRKEKKSVTFLQIHIIGESVA